MDIAPTKILSFHQLPCRSYACVPLQAERKFPAGCSMILPQEATNRPLGFSKLFK